MRQRLPHEKLIDEALKSCSESNKMLRTLVEDIMPPNYYQDLTKREINNISRSIMMIKCYNPWAFGRMESYNKRKPR